MTAEATAWVVILAAAGGLAFLCARLAGRRPFARLLIALLVFAWAATPHPYDDEHLAPAFAVFAFRWLLEDGANPRPPFAMLVLATILVLALCGAAKGVTAYRRSRTPSATSVKTVGKD